MAKTSRPHLIVISGPNGAGKSTIAPRVLRGTLGVTEFVNADVIAKGLSAFNPEGAALPAGRIMLERLKELAEERTNFAFETTLASRTFAPWIRELRASHYLFHLIYLWLPSPDQAVNRVKTRVGMGGHHVPEETIRRRHGRGLINFFELYQPVADAWRCYDASQPTGARIVAAGRGAKHVRVHEKETWNSILHAYEKARSAEGRPPEE